MPTPTDKEALLELATSYATFLREKLSPTLKVLVADRDEIDEERANLVNLLNDTEVAGPAQFPPQENCFENPSTTSPPSNPTYAPSTTISAFMSPDPAAAHPPTPANTLTLGDGTSAPITSKVEVESLPGTMYMAIGLNFFIELRSPEEVMTAAGDRVDFLTDKIERKQKDIDVVAVDVRAVLANLEEVGGEMRERGE